MFGMQRSVTFARDIYSTYRKSSFVVTAPKSRERIVFVFTVELPYFCPCFTLALLQKTIILYLYVPKPVCFLSIFRGTLADSFYNNSIATPHLVTRLLLFIIYLLTVYFELLTVMSRQFV